jgi:hypothetical protein
MAEYALVLVLLLEIKHFAADYILQFPWMIEGKGNLKSIGGYAHAFVHSVGTVLVLGAVSVPTAILISIAAAEFVIHYALDFAKFRANGDLSSTKEPRRYWALYGFDQFLHHATYIVIVWVVISMSPA